MSTGKVSTGDATEDKRTPFQHTQDFLRTATTPHQRAVATEIRRLFDRVDGLLEANNRYQQEARDARASAHMATMRALAAEKRLADIETKAEGT